MVNAFIFMMVLFVLADKQSMGKETKQSYGNYISNGFLKVSCNGGLNQMRDAICYMVTVARLLNLTLVVPELDNTSFWADPCDFEDIFDVGYFIESLRDEVRIVKRLPKRFSRKYGFQPLEMPPVSWSSEKYYLEQGICFWSLKGSYLSK